MSKYPLKDPKDCSLGEAIIGLSEANQAVARAESYQNYLMSQINAASSAYPGPGRVWVDWNLYRIAEKDFRETREWLDKAMEIKFTYKDRIRELTKSKNEKSVEITIF